MSKFRKSLWAVVGVALILTAPLYAQDAYNTALGLILKSLPAGNVLGADDSDVAILVRHIGSSAEGSGKVAVAAGGDLTFTAGPTGSLSAVDDFECPVSGGLGGVIDVSDTACDTIGEVVDTINGNCTGCTKGNWVAVILDGLRSDSSNDSLLTISATTADSPDGLALNWDTDTVGFNSTIAMVPAEARKMGFYLRGVPDSPKLAPNPFVNTRAVILSDNATSTFGSGTSTFQLKSVHMANGANNGLGSEVVTSIYAEAGGATTVNKLFGGTNGFAPYGVWGRQDEKLIARLSNSAAMASTVHRAYGLFVRQ